MSTMKEFVQRVEVVGVDQAVREMRELGVNTETLGRKTEDAGKKSTVASSKFNGLTSVLRSVGSQAKTMIAGFLGLTAVIQLFSKLISQAKELLELQKELTASAVTDDKGARKIAGQLGVDVEKAQLVSTQVRAAGGLSPEAAESLIIAADIAMRDENGEGGALAGNNLAMIKEVAAFSGAKDFSNAATGSLIELLKSADRLQSVDMVKESIAKISAASDSSRAANVGEFVEIAKAGGEGLLQAGVPFEEVLKMAVQARQVEQTSGRAAHTLEVLQQLAIGGAEEKFNKEMARVARQKGMNLEDMSSAQKVDLARGIFAEVDTQEEENRLAKMISPERFLRIMKAFRQSNVAATEGTTAAMAGADADDFESVTRSYKRSISFKRARNEAWEEYENSQVGRELFTYDEARRTATSEHKRAVARGETSDFWGEEPQIEHRMMEDFAARRDELQRQGADTTEIDKIFARGHVGGMTNKEALDAYTKRLKDERLSDREIDSPWDFGYGYDDDYLKDFAAAIDEAERKVQLNQDAAYRESGSSRPVTIVNNHIGTQYNDSEPGRYPVEEVDLNN